jgi:hypothetical protein
MTLDRNDLEYFDGKFGEVRKDLGAVHEKCNHLSEIVAAHHAAPCHDAQKDSFGKSIGIVGVIVAVIMSVLAFIKTHVTNGGGPK